MSRIVIVGGPRTGKTTLAKSLGLPVKHTDDLISLGWSEASAAAAEWLNADGDWVIEGVATARALRKWLKSNPEGKPCDVVQLVINPVVTQTPGQIRMGQGVMSVWHEIAPEIVRRGVRIDD